MKRITASVILGFLFAAGGTVWLLNNFTFNDTPSEPIGLYRITHRFPGRDSLTLLHDPLKRLVGVPGDTIRVTVQGTYVNDKLVANSAVPENSPYPPYPYQTLTLGPDMYWVIGNHPASFDSRYIGAIPGSMIAATAEPVWVK